ncbi:MAG: YifB family Mg chelatase-like AAA ATPase [Coriobacteriaceae bacterium]|nr:YifB family Mg chelatase-like AAA ATPase [Coriobacteriaceae bacterium]
MAATKVLRGHMRSCTLHGVEPAPVMVEVDVGFGVPGMFIVGMVDTAVQEAKHRVRAAIKAAGFEMPAERRIVVSLAPADLRKSGSSFDLPIALALLIALGQVPAEPFEGMMAVGELTLEGGVRPVNGLLAYAQGAVQQGLALLSAPVDMNLPQLPGLQHSCISRLGQLHTGELDSPSRRAGRPAPSAPDYRDVVGQDTAVRALTIAAAGGHGALLVGPPGSGKSMLARRLPSILPPLSPQEQVEAAVIHSVAGYDVSSIAAGVRPFRAPHHSATVPSLVGGGNPLRPGEASLAHNGVLFLDELGEFSSAALQGLRQPMEEGEIALCRADGRAVFPARFQLLAASNPCPCGYLGDREKNCSCSDNQVNRYQGKLGGPLRDRIDLSCEVMRVDPAKVMRTGQGTSSRKLADQVAAARERAAARGEECRALASTVPSQVIAACGLTGAQRLLIEEMARMHQLSGRGIIRVLRVARTIADLGGEQTVSDDCLLEALMFRGVGGLE